MEANELIKMTSKFIVMDCELVEYIDETVS